MKIQTVFLISLLVIFGLAMAGPQTHDTDFRFDYSLEWTPVDWDFWTISIDQREASLVSITYVRKSDKTNPDNHRIAEFITGPFSKSEVSSIAVNKFGGVRPDKELYRLVKNRPLFVVEIRGTPKTGIKSINLYRYGSRWFELWRLWQPHWVFVTDLKNLAPAEQKRLIEEKFGIKDWIYF